jgi:hypothetical protein
MPRVSPTAIEPVLPEQAELVARDVVRELDRTSQHKINLLENKDLSPREKQKAAVGFLAQLISHPTFRERYVLYALNNPGKVMEHAISTLPKEIMVESHTYLERVEIIKPATLDEWQAMIQERPKDALVMEAAVVDPE